MPDVRMPRLSDTMEEGTILGWLKADGDDVVVGDELVEIETDKATAMIEAEAAGVLVILALAGETVAVGGVVARLGTGAEALPAAVAAVPATEAGAASTPTPLALASAAPAAAPPAPAARPAASPVARRIARDRGIDLAGVSGSGPNGRIVKADVLAHEPPASVNGNGASSRREEPTRIQQLIARRMTEAKATIPEFFVETDADMTECVAVRARLKELGSAPSYNDMVVRAAALALRDFPRLNGSFRDGGFELHERVNVGVAVAAPDTLTVPTILDADIKSLGAIAVETRALAEAVRTGTIGAAQLSGGTFTVSNLGMFGVTRMGPIINAPQAAILGVGALRQMPVVRDGEIVVRSIVCLTLVCDHRILYGADAANVLARIRELLEEPLRLLL